MYINDYDLETCFKKLPELLADDCIIYLTETVAVRERLTLDSLYSDDLQDSYDVIYRTVKEYYKICQPLFDGGFKIIKEDSFIKPNKQNDTSKWWIILKR